MKFVFVRKPVVNARPLLSIFIISGMSLAAINAGFGQDKQTPNIVTRIPGERVTSGAIAAIGSSGRLQFLDIEFLNGAIYRSVALPRSIDHGLMQADSKAHYFQQHIEGRFKTFRIRRWQAKQTGVPDWIAFDNASF